MTVVYVYKKEDDFKFLSRGVAKMSHYAFISNGYRHISTINAALMLNKVYDVINEDYSDTEKVEEIKKMITEK
jgi:hypothetical protein